MKMSFGEYQTRKNEKRAQGCTNIHARIYSKPPPVTSPARPRLRSSCCDPWTRSAWASAAHATAERPSGKARFAHRGHRVEDDSQCREHQQSGDDDQAYNNGAKSHLWQRDPLLALVLPTAILV